MNMIYWYTARGIFAPDYEDGMSWREYLKWSKLTHLVEVCSLDAMLNELLVEPNFNSPQDWDFIVTDGGFNTGLFSDFNYVLSNAGSLDRYNFLMVVKEPESPCELLTQESYDFIGYDLLDKDYLVSALVNCGGFDETFAGNELNSLGLVSNYVKAFEIREQLLLNNPDEYHADCNVIGVWRHQIIGRS